MKTGSSNTSNPTHKGCLKGNAAGEAAEQDHLPDCTGNQTAHTGQICDQIVTLNIIITLRLSEWPWVLSKWPWTHSKQTHNKILKETIIWERWDEGHEVWWNLSQAKNWKTTNPHWMKRPTLCQSWAEASAYIIWFCFYIVKRKANSSLKGREGTELTTVIPFLQVPF